MAEPVTAYDDEPWVIPLHGIDAPRSDARTTIVPVADDDVTPLHLYADLDDDLPTIEFRPQLRRSA